MSLLKRKRYKPEHKAPKQYIKVATSDLHRNCTNYIPVNPRQPNQPRRSGFPRENHACVIPW